MTFSDDREDRAELGAGADGASPLEGEGAARLLQLARGELPSAELEARVLGELGYRSRLLAEERTESPVTRRLVLGATAFAAAAAILFWFRGAEQQTERAADAEREPVELGKEPVRDGVATQAAGQSAAAAPEPSVAPVLSAPAKQEPSLEAAHWDPCSTARVATGAQPLIDDFEDADDAIRPNEGRGGLWRWVRDTDAPGTAPALLPLPRADKAANNAYALHVKGERLREWGATVEFVFQQFCYDASAYAGIAFDAMGSTRIYAAPREVSVIPREGGGTCKEDCHNNHVVKIELSKDWRSYEVRFDQVEQRGYDRPPLNPKQLHSLAFLIRPEDTPYEVWLDNVRFLER